MPGYNFTILTQFGSASGPTFTGSQTILPPAVGNNPQQIGSQVVGHGNTNTVWTGAAAYSDLQPVANTGGGFGIQSTVLNLNSNANTPSCTVKFLNNTQTALSFALAGGNAYAVANPNTMWTATTATATSLANTVTSIQVIGDTISDLTISGTLNFNT